MNIDNNHMILVNQQCRTAEIASCQYRHDVGKYAIMFTKNPKTYLYRKENVVILRNGKELNPADYRIKYNGTFCQNINKLIEFRAGSLRYYRIVYASGSVAEYSSNDIEITESCLNDEKSKAVFDYFKDVASANALKGDDELSLLARQYQNVDFLEIGLAIASYIAPDKSPLKKQKAGNLIFPFGCNTSQLKAVQTAFESQMSVVQGPPGTGKTQTILNIIANILMAGKTVMVVSNNNSATENVLEKLAKHQLGFLVAPLGRSENKQAFVASQTKGRVYPENLSEWENERTEKRGFIARIHDQVERIKEVFEKQELLAIRRQELAAIELEQRHFFEEVGVVMDDVEIRASSKHILQLLNEQQEMNGVGSGSLIGRIKQWFRQLVYRYIYKIGKDYLQQPTEEIIKKTQALFYLQKVKELKDEIAALETQLEGIDANRMMQTLSNGSMSILRHHLYKRYGCGHEPVVITEDILKHNPNAVLGEFPVILSTTFSARSSLRNATYDYLIMDEASQVSVETGVLALSCARNAIIVGDTMQLPNVVTAEDKERLDAIRRGYDLNDGYDCANKSFLQSVLDVIPHVPQTLLREHYRCAPQIIDFCNQKFYGGNLIIMTKSDRGENAMSAIKTVPDNHSRNHVNQREIDVITHEVLPKLDFEKSEIGVITPYNKQVNAISAVVGNEIETYTVHKFQGREKDVIVMSVVDDQISSFADDPNILNVAVSRAKKKFILVVSGNEQESKGNITDLLGYIQYQEGAVVNSSIHSVFDLLYKQYAEARAEFLQAHKRISEYDSENLMYAIIQEVLASSPAFQALDVVCHYPMNMLLGDRSPLSEEERRYASNRRTHLDFLVFSRVSKQAILAIEVDGWQFHQEGSRQSERDQMKNHIMALYNIPLLRLSTTGSGEKEKVATKLSELLK